MLTKEFLQFIKDQDEYISHVYGNSDVEKRLLARTVKLAEETGEVSDAVLAYLNDQRKEKLEEQSELGDELADVVIVCALIAQTVGIDISEALTGKMAKITKRQYGNNEKRG